jgi:DNA-binding NtrC family response regulator
MGYRLQPPQREDSLALVIEDGEGLSRFLSRLLRMLGLECCTYPSAMPAIASLELRHPAIIFLDLALHESNAIEVIKSLGDKKYAGVVQLMSGAVPDQLDAVQWVAMRNGLLMRPPLRKPFPAEAVRETIASLGREVPPLRREPDHAKDAERLQSAIRRKIGDTLSGNYDLSQPLPDTIRALVAELDEPRVQCVAEKPTYRG